MAEPKRIVLYCNHGRREVMATSLPEAMVTEAARITGRPEKGFRATSSEIREIRFAELSIKSSIERVTIRVYWA